MTDRAIGLIGLAITIFALIAPYRWPKVHRAITDIGLIAGTIIAVIAFEPDWAPLVTPPATALVDPLPAVPAPIDQSNGQQDAQSLRTQLAAMQVELNKTKDLLAINEAVAGWGIFGGSPGTLFMKVDATKFAKYQNKMKLMFIARIVYENVDRMSDTHIAKSPLYSISDSVVTLTREGLAGLLISGAPGTPLVAEFDLVGFPSGFVNVDRINSLETAEKLGGILLAARESNIETTRALPFAPLQQTASACPK